MTRLYKKCNFCSGGWFSLFCDMCDWGYESPSYLSIESYRELEKLVDDQQGEISQLTKDNQDLENKLFKLKTYDLALKLYSEYQNIFANTVSDEYNVLKKKLDSIMWPTKGE